MSAKKSSELMDLLQRAAGSFKDSFASETVRSTFMALVKLGGPGVSVFLTDVLHGEYGEESAAVSWRAITQRGVLIGGEGTSNPLHTSFGAYCLFKGNLDLLREVALRGPSPYIQVEDRPTGSSQLLDLLCTTKKERESQSFVGMDRTTGLVGVAVANARDCAFASDALALAWEVDPRHVGFTALFDDVSHGGALLRFFLLNQAVSDGADRALEAVASQVATDRAAYARQSRCL